MGQLPPGLAAYLAKKKSGNNAPPQGPQSNLTADNGPVARRMAKKQQAPQDKTESPADQAKIAAARKIIAEQQKIIYDLQHNGK